MSTTYYTTVPMTIEQVIERTGWTKHVNGEGGTMLTKNDAYIEWGEFDYDGKRWCTFERWGWNDATDFEQRMAGVLVSEHEHAFWKLPWNKDQSDAS